MRTIEEGALVEIEKIKGSRFIGLVYPAKNMADANQRLQEIKMRFADARHWCWAWRGSHRDSIRYSDDGEPSGTAGKPIQVVLEGAMLCEALGVVVRYFGGTKLGKGGLVRAYTEAMKAAVNACVTVERVEKVRVALILDYAVEGPVRYLLDSCAAVLEHSEYTQKVSWRVVLPVVHIAQMRDTFAELTAGQGEFEILED